MKYILVFIISFLIIYLVHYLLIVRRDKGIEAFKKGNQVLFFKKAYNLDLNKLNYKKFAKSLSLTNAFIVAFTVTIIEFIEGNILKLLVGFVILIPLILICYYILGKTYKKKEGK